MLTIGSRVLRNRDNNAVWGIGTMMDRTPDAFVKIKWRAGEYIGWYEESDLIELTFKQYYDACNTERSSKTVI